VFERFTDRARRVLVLAQEEARLLNHSFIGTEHILLGLIQEGDGLAAKALESLDISLEQVRAKVVETIGPAGSPPGSSPPFTPRAKKVLELSLREALQFGHNYIGTEHILLGLVREGEGVAAQVLTSFGADLAAVRGRVLLMLTGHQGSSVGGVQRVHGLSGMTAVAEVADLTELRFPYKVLSGGERPLGSPTLGLRVLGVLLYDDGVNVIWRLQGVPGAVTRLVEGAATLSRRPRDARTAAGTPPSVPSATAPMPGEVEPFIVLSDDIGTPFRAVGTAYQPQDGGEWAGSCDFVPCPLAGSSTLTLTWENDSITLAL
jgi:Clp amino terminal domain, pathogenicity island component